MLHSLESPDIISDPSCRLCGLQADLRHSLHLLVLVEILDHLGLDAI